MKYKVLATSIFTHLGRTLKQGETVDADVFDASHIADLVNAKAIEEVKTEIKTPTPPINDKNI